MRKHRPFAPAHGRGLFAEGDVGPHPFDLRLLLSGEGRVRQLDGEFLQIARKPKGHMIILTDGRAGVLADVERFIGGDAERGSSLDAAFGDLPVVPSTSNCALPGLPRPPPS